MIHESERKDFKDIVEDNKYTLNDFELIEVADKFPSDGHIYPITGKVTIKNKKSGKEKTYATGHGSVWLDDFDKDLKNKYFN
jgi:hypothetical protein